jgi:hypothetical protein
MVAKIIKLDEYLLEYLERNKHDIAAAISDALQLSYEQAEDMFYGLDQRQKVDVLNILTSDQDDLVKKQVLRGIFSNVMRQYEEINAFNGIDIAEGFNYKNFVKNESARNNVMDWLEESGIEYLIDNNGNFAVKCPDRKTQYHVSRKFEHVMNKWDNGPSRKSVDPDSIRKGLSDMRTGNVLSDMAEDARDGSMPISTGAGAASPFTSPDTPPMRYEDSEAGAVAVLGDMVDPYTSVHAEPDPTKEYVWIVMLDDNQTAFLVDTENGTYDEVDYADAMNLMNENVGGKKSFSRAADSIFNPATSSMGRDYAVPGETTIDPKTGTQVPLASQERRVNAFARIPNSELMAVADQGFAAKAKLLRKYTNIPDSRIMDAVKALNREISTRRAEAMPAESVVEAKGTMAKKAKKKERDAKEKLEKPAGAGVAAKIAHDHAMQHGNAAGAMDKDNKKKYTRKEKHKSKMDEQLAEGSLILGMTGMPTTSVNRLRQLAGLPSDAEVTETVIEPVDENEPTTVITKFSEAMGYLKELFNIYRTMDTEERSPLRRGLVDIVTEDGPMLSESIVKLLVNKEKKALFEAFEDIDMATVRDNLRKLKVAMNYDLEEWQRGSSSYSSIKQVVDLLEQIEEVLV